jgi:hypothetical protein
MYEINVRAASWRAPALAQLTIRHFSTNSGSSAMLPAMRPQNQKRPPSDAASDLFELRGGERVNWLCVDAPLRVKKTRTGIFISECRDGRPGPRMLGGEIEQFCRGATEDVGLFVVAERCRGENVVHGMQLPGIGIIAAQHDLTGADLGRQMADRLG